MNTRKWENGVIPYSFDLASGYSPSEIAVIIDGMRKIEEQTNRCLTFKERTIEPNWVEFKDTTNGCWSYIGKVGNGAQLISLQKSSGCVYQRVAIHELVHAAGFEHEHMRSDRDQYIKIISANIQSGQEYNFNKLTASTMNRFDIPYDYYSIM